jgi:hypothetical protein
MREMEMDRNGGVAVNCVMYVARVQLVQAVGW